MTQYLTKRQPFAYLFASYERAVTVPRHFAGIDSVRSAYDFFITVKRLGYVSQRHGTRVQRAVPRRRVHFELVHFQRATRRYSHSVFRSRFFYYSSRVHHQ